MRIKRYGDVGSGGKRRRRGQRRRRSLSRGVPLPHRASLPTRLRELSEAKYMEEGWKVRCARWSYVLQEEEKGEGMKSKMRQHLKKCLEQGSITMFPVKRMRRGTKVKTTEQIPVYCSCRMPELPQTKWIECSGCKEWYHAGTCIKVQPKYLNPKYKWFCPL